MALYPYTIVGSSYSRTESGEEATLTFKVSELTGTPAGRMIEAVETNGIPRQLARHPTRASLVATEFRATPEADQPNTALVTVRYKSEGLLSDQSELGRVTVSMSTEVIAEETTTDINGDQIRTSYVSRAVIGAGGSSISTTRQTHRVSVERVTFAVQFTRVEDQIAFSKATQFAGKVNSLPWQGKPAKHWLIRISSTPTDRDDRFAVRYDAVFNPQSWRATITHVESGLTPSGLTVTNGTTVYDVYESIDYNQLQLPRRL